MFVLLAFTIGILVKNGLDYLAERHEVESNDDLANTIGVISADLEDYVRSHPGALPPPSQVQQIVDEQAHRTGIKLHCEHGNLVFNPWLSSIDYRHGRHPLAWCSPPPNDRLVTVAFVDSGKFEADFFRRQDFDNMLELEIRQHQ